jgi:predicted CXXCH cytochrome family protein
MKFNSAMALVPLLLQMAVIAGCGSDSTTNVPVSTLAASQTCFSCHSGANSTAPSISPVTGSLYTADWMLSAHNTSSAANKSGSGAGCTDCHGPAHNHPNNYCGQCHGGAGAPTQAWLNPDSSGQCWNCHRSDLPKKSPAHFYNITGAGNHPAMYVTARRQTACSSCHNPHVITPPQQLKDWADSDHGNVTEVAWATEDFKNVVSSGSYQCIRCHTATGFKNFLAGNWANPFPTSTWATAADGKGREVLTCDACHANYDFRNSFRRPPAFTAPYNKGLNPAVFPDVGASNLCIACHSGRESADSLKAVADFTNAGFVNPHYLAAAGLMYLKTGFTGFADPSAISGTIGTLNGVKGLSLTYGQSYTSDSNGGALSSTHRKFGTPGINGDSHNPSVFTPGNFDADGPCVTCHMNAAGRPDRLTSHSWQINGNTYNQVCINCHISEGATALNADNFRTAFLEEQSAIYQEALTLVQTLLLKNYKISFDMSAYPYFYDENLPLVNGKKQAVRDWTRGTNDQQFGLKIMGVCFNFNLLKREPAAYVHARTYARRLIYDSIDFLDNDLMDNSVSATAVTTDPANFSNGGTSATSSAAFNYLVKFNGAAGALDTTRERP